MQLTEESAPGVRTGHRSGFAPTGLVAITLVIVAAIVAYWPTVESLLRFWNDYDNLSYTHGYLIVAVCGWLTWRARHRIAGSWGGLSISGLIALLTLSVAWGVAYVAGIEVGHQLLFPLLVLAAIVSFAGWRTGGVMLLPVGYLVFAIPVWDLINGLLQQLTVVAVTLFLKLVAVPAWFEGNLVHLGAGTFEIAGGCSGLHFFIVANAIAILYGELGHDTLATRIKLVLIAAGMALVMNWVRVATIIVAGYLTDMQSFLVKIDHYYFGWALFGVLLALYFWAMPKLLDLQPNVPPPVAGGRAAPQVSLAVAGAMAVTLAGLFAVPVLVHRAQAAVTASAEGSAGAPVLDGWLGPLPAAGSWRPEQAGADRTERVAYRNTGTEVELYQAYYRSQAQGREIGGYGSNLLAGTDWTIVDARAVTVAATQPAFSYVQLTVAGRDGKQWIVGYFYDVGGRTFTRELLAKLYYPFALLQERPDSRVIAAAVACGDDCGAAATELNRFLTASHAALRGIGAG